MSIYARFSSKAGLTTHLLAEGFRRLTTAIDVTGNSASETMRASGAAYRQFALANPALYRLMFARELALGAFPLVDEAVGAAALAFATLERQAGAFARERHLTAAPVDVAMLFWSAVHGFVSLELDDRSKTQHHDQVYELLLQAMIAGVGSL
jgi:AcrR family transcriptional regulator